MSLINDLLGKQYVKEMTDCGSVGAVGDGPPLGLVGKTHPSGSPRRLRFTTRRKRVVKEGTDSIFPEEAKPLDAGETEASMTDTPDLEGEESNNPEEPQIPEPLIPVTAALVAPDTTPDWYKPIDPTQVPEREEDEVHDPEEVDRDPVLNAILGRKTGPAPTNTAAVESVVLPAGIPSAAEFAGGAGSLNEVIATSMTPGVEQPPPPPRRDINEHLETMRKLGQL